jgi:hypothetical protein
LGVARDDVTQGDVTLALGLATEAYLLPRRLARMTTSSDIKTFYIPIEGIMISAIANAALKSLSAEFDRLYSPIGRWSILI